MTETSFACALSAAISRAGLSLRQLQRALETHGTTVSVATLSYWSSGRSRPERDVATALAALEEVLQLPGGELSALLGRAFDALGAPRRVTVEVADLRTVPGYVAAGLGVAVVPDLPAPDGPGVVVVPLAGAGLEWPLNVVTSAAKPPSRALRTLLDLLAADI